MLTAGFRIASGSVEHRQTSDSKINVRCPNVLRRCRGTVSWWRAAERRWRSCSE